MQTASMPECYWCYVLWMGSLYLSVSIHLHFAESSSSPFSLQATRWFDKCLVWLIEKEMSKGVYDGITKQNV